MSNCKCCENDKYVDVADLIPRQATSEDIFLGLDGEGNIAAIENPSTSNELADRISQLEITTSDLQISKVNLSGDNMTGPLILSRDPETAMESATKQYVDERAINTYHTFDPKYFTDIDLEVSLAPNSIGDEVISNISQSKVINLTSDLDSKNGRIMAGEGIELTQNPDGTTTVRAVQDLYEVVDELPATGVANKIYLVPNGDGTYAEWLWVNGGWEPAGESSATVDLSNYYNKQNVDTLLSQKADNSVVENHIEDTNNPHQVTKAQIGLGNVQNTADLDKPISTATQMVLDSKANDSDVVKLAGLQMITGSKVFESGLRINTTGYITPYVTGTSYIGNSSYPFGSGYFNDLSVNNSPVSGNSVTNKLYVDNAISNITVNETDPVFTAWKNGTNIIIGEGSSSNNNTLILGVASKGYNAADGIIIGNRNTLGNNSTSNVGTRGIVIGVEAQGEGSNSVSIGYTTKALATNSTALGWGANATATRAFQLGQGTNSSESSLQFRNYQLVDANGKIPMDRLPIQRMTQAEFDGITPDPNIIYIIVG